KTHLSRLLERAAGGEDIVIARAGVPVARLVPVVVPERERPLGMEKGRMIIADDFDLELPDDIIRSFER
ncbi:MAG: type II toxin-antitoxin system Phd/YefM family antitoxin, partial [Gemmatimonadales bacterium]